MSLISLNFGELWLFSFTLITSPALTSRPGELTFLPFSEVAVYDQLSRFLSGGSQSQSVNHIIKSALQQDQQVVTGNSLSGGSFLKQVSELRLLQSVKSLGLLLFSQLQSVF